jgi:hypothetical protein
MLEEPIMQLDTLCDVIKQIERHLELAAKIPLEIHRMLNEVVDDELVVRINSSPWDKLVAEDGTIMLRSHVLMHEQEHSNNLLFLHVKLLIGGGVVETQNHLQTQ